MKDRLTVILNENKLTAWKFAEILGVQPSSLSHIFSGRNKASLDLVDKVLSNFPDISPDWLIFGTGDMYRVSEADSMPPIDSDIEIISDEDVFEEDLEQGDSLDNRYDNSGIPADKPYVTNVNTSVDEIVTEDDTKDVFTNVNTSFVQNIVSLESEKTIESITVFYTDSTFKIYKQIK